MRFYEKEITHNPLGCYFGLCVGFRFKTFNQATYSQDFPDISAWYNGIDSNPAFQYIDAFNNRTKHTCDVYLKVSMDFLGENHSSDINPFFRKDVQHDKKNISDYLNQIFDLVDCKMKLDT